MFGPYFANHTAVCSKLVGVHAVYKSSREKREVMSIPW